MIYIYIYIYDIYIYIYIYIYMYIYIVWYTSFYISDIIQYILQSPTVAWFRLEAALSNQLPGSWGVRSCQSPFSAERAAV